MEQPPAAAGIQLANWYWRVVRQFVSEPVYNLFRISTVKASTTICRLVLSFLSQFFQSRRHFSRAKDRSTTHRFGHHEGVQFVAFHHFHRGPCGKGLVHQHVLP